MNSKLHTLARTTSIHLAILTLAGSMAGCTAIGNLFGGESTDYKSGAAKARPLEVPPDLTQLARDSRYQVQGGVVSASASTQAGRSASGAPVLATQSGVAITTEGAMRIERSGQQRWLVVPVAPEQLWPVLKTFWEQKGFTLDVEDAKAGVLETNWSMNRAKLPADAVRNTLGRLLGKLYDTGERDRYRTRIERVPGSAAVSEIYISHRGAQEMYLTEGRDTTTWRGREPDPQLEAEMLSQLMVALGEREAAAKQVVAASSRPAGAAPAAPSAGSPTAAASGRPAGAVSRGPTALDVEEPFDRAWRRVGLALDRGGFTVEDRDRAAGLYFVRYVDPKSAGTEEPGWWSRLLGNTLNPHAAVRYQVALKGDGNKTRVTVLSSSGAAEVGENGQRIAALLVNELR